MSVPRDSLPRALILQHESFTGILDGRLLMAPLKTPVGRVLDLGTGCGIWAAEFAAEHPTAEVIGIDNWPQPKIVAPPNCRFVDRDAEQDWELGDVKFDVIHTRLVPFHAEAWPVVLRRCYEHLNPGGYVEMHESWPPARTDEPPGAPEHESKVIEWGRLRFEAAAKLGIDQDIPGKLPGLLAAAGFVDVQIEDYKWPIGPWMDDDRWKKIGDMSQELLQAAMMGLSKELLANIGMGEAQVVDFVEQVGKQLGVGKIYGPVRIIWARKPE